MPSNVEKEYAQAKTFCAWYGLLRHLFLLQVLATNKILGDVAFYENVSHKNATKEA